MAFIKRTRKKVCKLCQSHIEHIDYKNIDLLQEYISSIGKILPRRVSGACTMHQRKVTNAIKRARIVALLPFIKSE